MRKLKFHEQKLLKKVDFLQWKNEHKLRELQVGWPGCCLQMHHQLNKQAQQPPSPRIWCLQCARRLAPQ